MAWIELHQAVWTHRKTFELASQLDLDETYAAAHVVRLWTWAIDNAPDGNLAGLSDRAIAYGAGWRGNAAAFMGALIDAGWVDGDRRIHDWDEYAGRLVERREANAQRMRAARAARKHSTADDRASHVQRTVHERAGLPDRTGPDTTGPDRTITPLFPPLSEGGGADAPSTASAPTQADLMRGLSQEARAVLDYHRECHGSRRPARLTPESARVLEEAVADLGVERLRESVKYMAGKIPPVTELSKAISAARTKRLNGSVRSPPTPARNGTHPVKSQSVAQTPEEEAALEAWANGH